MLLRNLSLLFGALSLFCITGFSQDITSRNFSNSEHLSFISNEGQFNGRNWNSGDSIHYAYSSNPFYAFFTKTGVVYRLDKIVKNKKHKEDPKEPKRKNISELVHVKWLNANKDVEIVAESAVDFHYSYAMYNEDKTIRNINNVQGFRKITYKNIYDHIDIEYTIHPEGGIKYTVIVHPGGNPADVRASYSGSHTSGEGEFVNVALNVEHQLEIETSLGKIVEHAPATFSNETPVRSNYTFENNILGFDIESYDATQDLVIDPWVVSPTFNSSTAVWEVETDGSGNVYTIGGETPMELWKYNSAGALQWQYVTPWDTSSVWLGTLATDALGNSYVTSGVTAEMHKVNNAGGFVWQTTLSGGLQYNSEWWSITFNCDETKLITGGTWVQGILSFDFYAGIFEIDVATGNVISDQTVDYTNIGGFGATPVEVRSISSSKNSKFIYLTHHDVGAINENFGSCPNVAPIYQVDNGHHLGYKCENYLPSTQNGGGLKALVANDNYIYTHSGDQIHRRDLATGALINSVSLPGGNNTIDFFGNTVVHCSGLDVDDCGNVYAGSTNQVVKFDQNLNQLSTSATTFAVYDVSVNSNGEVIACGAQQNNQATNRNGRVESIALTACSQYALVCCDANVCAEGPFCVTDPAVALTPFTAGGTWSGTGVDAAGNFDPAVAGVGTHTITYTLPCGAESISIVVNQCNVIELCEETNGDLTASGGVSTYSWYEATITPVSTPITNEQECIDCASATPTYIAGFYISCSQSTCSYNDTTWTLYATGTTTTAPSSYPILIIDGNNDSLLVLDGNSLTPCTASPCSGVTITVNIDSQTNVTCNGASDGTASVSASGGTGSYTYTWIPGNLSGASQTGLSATTYAVQAEDQNGCTGSENITITEPAAITPTASLIQDPTGCGLSDGIIEVCGLTASTSYDDLSYFDGTSTVALGAFTSNGSGCYQITGLSAGSYSNFTVTLAGCTGVDAGPIVLTDPSAPAPTASLVQDPTGCGLSDGIIEVCGLTANTSYDDLSYFDGTSTVAIGSFTSNGSGCYQITGLPAGSYSSFTVTLSGCSGSDAGPIALSDPSGPTPTASLIQDPTGCGLSDGIIEVCGLTANTSYDDLSYFDGTSTVTLGAFTSNGSGCYQITGLPAGSYSSFTVTLSGCSGSDAGPVTLTDPNAPAPTASLIQDPTGCGLSDGIIEVCGLTASTSYDDLSYFDGTSTVTLGSFTSNGSGCYQITGLPAGSYSSFTVTLSGCSGSDAGPVALSDPSGPTPTASLVQDPSGCGLSDGIIEVCGLTANTSYDDLSYFDGTSTVSLGAFTSNGSGCYQITGLPAGSYSSFTVTLSGCSGSDAGPVALSDPSGPTPTASLVQDPTGCGLSDGIIEVCGLTANTSYDDLSYFDGTSTVSLGAFTSNGSGCYQITGLSSGTYSNFTVTLSGCTGTDAGSITLTGPTTPTPTATLVQDPSGCGASDGIIEICGLSANTSYDDLSYFDGTNTMTLGSFTSNGSGCYQITALSAGSYSNFTVTLSGCSGSDAGPIALAAPNAPVITVLTTTDADCFGGSTGTATIAVSGGTYPYTYSWSPSGGTDSTAIGLSAGTYTVTVTDNGGCISTTTVTIGEPSQLVLSGTVVDENCGQSDGSITTSVSGGTTTYNYIWSPNNETTPGLSNISSGSYAVTVTDANGCTASQTFSVSAIGNIPVIATPNSANIDAGETVQLTATGATTYVWTPSGSLDCADCANPIASPTETTTYIVTGTDASGCSGSDTVTIYVTINCADLFVPNIFSPNGSGPQENETLCVYGNCISELSFRVFNRWGQLVFETESPYTGTGNTNEICWDGMFKGKPVQNGTYVYSLYAVKFDGEVVELSGNITVVR